MVTSSSRSVGAHGGVQRGAEISAALHCQNARRKVQTSHSHSVYILRVSRKRVLLYYYFLYPTFQSVSPFCGSLLGFRSVGVDFLGPGE